MDVRLLINPKVKVKGSFLHPKKKWDEIFGNPGRVDPRSVDTDGPCEVEFRDTETTHNDSRIRHGRT